MGTRNGRSRRFGACMQGLGADPQRHQGSRSKPSATSTISGQVRHMRLEDEQLCTEFLEHCLNATKSSAKSFRNGFCHCAHCVLRPTPSRGCPHSRVRARPQLSTSPKHGSLPSFGRRGRSQRNRQIPQAPQPTLLHSPSLSTAHTLYCTSPCPHSRAELTGTSRGPRRDQTFRNRKRLFGSKSNNFKSFMLLSKNKEDTFFGAVSAQASMGVQRGVQRCIRSRFCW